MSLNKFTQNGGQNSGRENWMNLKMNNLEAENVTLKGDSVLIETQDNAGFNNFSTPNLGMPNFVLATDGSGNTSWLYLGDIDPSPSDPNLYTKTQNIDLVATIPNTTQINGTTNLDVVNANSITLDGSDVTDDLADLQLKTTDISYNPGITTTTISNTLNNTGLIHASGNLQVGGNLQVQTVDANLLNYKTPNLGTAGQVLTSNGLGGVSFTTPSASSGDVVGPASSVNNTLPLFDGTTGKLLKNESTIVYNSVDSQLEVPKIQSTQYKEGTYDGSLIKNFPVGSNNTFSFFATPPNLTATSDNNTFYGLYAGDNVTDSDNSTCIGVNTMRNSLSGADRSENTIIGKNAGQGTFISAFNNCTMLGSNAGQLLETGNNNTFIGQGAGNNQTTGDNNTLIGKNATTAGGDKTNAIAIGWEATVLNNNQVCIGNGTIEKIYNEGNGTCDLGAATRQFKDLYMTGNIIGSGLPIVTRFRITKTPDRPPATNPCYEDAYIALGWDQSTANDLEIIRKTGTPEYLSTTYKEASTSVNVISIVNVNTLYTLNTFTFNGGEIMNCRLSPYNNNTFPAYEISIHYTESSLGTDSNLDWIVKRYDNVYVA
jgi:hypothetical protein